MRLYFVVNARIPGEQAYSIQIVKTVESFIAQGREVVLVLPRRGHRTSICSYYELSVDVPVQYLPSFDLYRHGRILYLLSSLSFMLSYVIFLFVRKLLGEHYRLYTVALDSFSHTLLPAFAQTAVEVHAPPVATGLNHFFYTRVHRIVAINRHIGKHLSETFSVSSERVLIEPNGVDLTLFEEAIDKREARTKIGLPTDTRIALYIGRFYPWKGLELLPEVAERLVEAGIELHLLGGDAREFTKATGIREFPRNLHIHAGVPHHEVPLWQSAADVLLVLGTRKNPDSWYYTAPMKVFEYLAGRRPVVASKTPALTELVEGEVVWYEPDNAESLASAIQTAVDTPDPRRIDAGAARARQHAWAERARRILTHL